jgi:hypothetical protein
MIQGTVKPGAPILAPLSGEIVGLDYNSWGELGDSLHERGIGALFTAQILTTIQDARVINIIGPILYRYGTPKTMPEQGESVYRGEELGEVADISGTSNLTWTVYVHDEKGERTMNPLDAAKQYGVLQYYDDPGLLPEFDAAVPSRRPKKSFSPVVLGLLGLGAFFLLRKK